MESFYIGERFSNEVLILEIESVVTDKKTLNVWLNQQKAIFGFPRLKIPMQGAK